MVKLTHMLRNVPCHAMPGSSAYSRCLMPEYNDYTWIAAQRTVGLELCINCWSDLFRRSRERRPRLGQDLEIAEDVIAAHARLPTRRVLPHVIRDTAFARQYLPVGRRNVLQPFEVVDLVPLVRLGGCRVVRLPFALAPIQFRQYNHLL